MAKKKSVKKVKAKAKSKTPKTKSAKVKAKASASRPKPKKSPPKAAKKTKAAKAAPKRTSPPKSKSAKSKSPKSKSKVTQKKSVKIASKKAAKPKKTAAAKKPVATKKQPVGVKMTAKGSKAAPSKADPKQASTNNTPKKVFPDIERPTGMYGGVMLTDSPKPFPKKSPYTREELHELKKALIHERDRLRRELATMEGMTMGTAEGQLESPGFPTHIAEYASHMQATETILGVRSIEEERLEEIESAIRRLEQKANYGLCLSCGTKIGIERLVAKPQAHLCMDCRRAYEKNRAY